jgi:hypothetical protein
MSTELSSRFTSPGQSISSQKTDEARLDRELGYAARAAIRKIGSGVRFRAMTSAEAEQVWVAAVNSALTACGVVDPEARLYLGKALIAESIGTDAYQVAQGVMRSSMETYPAPSGQEINDRMVDALGLENISLVAAGFVDSLPKFGRQWRSRIQRVVRTTYTGFAGFVAFQAMRATRRETKTWVTRHDPKVRTTHAQADGQTVSLEQPFQVGDEQLMYPGDRRGVIGEVVNCRCTMISNS